jgi:hypothetical protein
MTISYGKKQPKKWWVRPTLLMRPVHGHYDHLIQELLENDRYGYRRFIRLHPEMFLEVVSKVWRQIQRRRTNFRDHLDAGMKVALNLRYLASGENYHSLEAGFRVSHSSIVKMVPEVCEALFNAYEAECLRCPNTTEEWKSLFRV